MDIRRSYRFALLPFIALLIGSSAWAQDRTDGTVQRQDTTFAVPDTGPPTYAPDQGPLVAIDEAHHNYHTAEGRYRPFADLLRRDGYRVERFTSSFTPEALSAIDLLVISNAISAEKENEWSLPAVAAFTRAEVEVVEAWVRAGGRLLLIADHMPMPGAAETLARAFGILFHDGYAYNADGASHMTFSKDTDLLAKHAVTSAEGGGEVPFVTTFTGQAFRLLSDVKGMPLLHLADEAYVLLPIRAWDFDEETPRIAGAELLQGALVEHGAGRIAVFGEAAAFSAQVQVRNGEHFPMGMNHPDAPHNARFLLNVMHWLAFADTP